MKVVYLLYMNHIAFDTMYSVAGSIRSPFTVRGSCSLQRFFPKLCPSRVITLLFPSDAVYSHNFEIPVVDD